MAASRLGAARRLCSESERPLFLERFVGKAGNAVLTILYGFHIVGNCRYATLQDRGGRSLTTDTMCQNPFETIRLFEPEWSE